MQKKNPFDDNSWVNSKEIPTDTINSSATSQPSAAAYSLRISSLCDVLSSVRHRLQRALPPSLLQPKNELPRPARGELVFSMRNTKNTQLKDERMLSAELLAMLDNLIEMCSGTEDSYLNFSSKSEFFTIF